MCRSAKRGKEAVADAGLVGHVLDEHAGLVADHGRPADVHVAHPRGLGHDPRALGVGERAADHERDVELLGELDGARMHDARADARQFQHLVVADGVELAGLGDDARVGGVDAVDVRIDLTADGVGDGRPGVGFMFEHRGQRDGRGVGPAAAQRGDVKLLVHALKAGDDDDLPFGERWRMRRVSMVRMRARVWVLSVWMPICAPVKLMAGTPNS